jgi:hypothetical protein
MTAIDRADHADPNGQEKRRPPELPAGDARALFSSSFEPAKTHERNQNLSVRG